MRPDPGLISDALPAFEEQLHSGVRWRHSSGLVAYPAAVKEMNRLTAAIHARTEPDTVWLLEHPPLYTAGVSAKDTGLLAPDRFEVHATGRGGQYTYHGPGQRVAYVMLDLRRRGQDVRAFVRALETWLQHTLAVWDVAAVPRQGRVGLWVDTPRGEEKIAAIGVRVRHWITLHGIALNVCPDLEHFSGIVPCGLSQYGVTSLHALGHRVALEEADKALMHTFQAGFPPCGDT
jgi:lipoyl(octanoyl) transferase